MASPWELNWDSQPAQQQAPPVASGPWDREWGAQQPAQPRTLTEKLGETWPARLAKGVVDSVKSAVTLPHDVMTGEAHVPGSADAQAIPGAVPYGSPDSSGERIVDLAGIALPSSGAAGSGRAIRGVYDAAKESAVPSVDALKATAKAGFQSPDVTGLTMKSPAVTNFADTTSIALNNAGVSDVLAPKTFALLERLKAAPEGSVITGQNVQTIRRAFGNAASSPDATERMAATSVLKHLDEFLPNVSKSDVISGDPAIAAKTLETARANYSAAKHAETIDDKMFQAELRAASANSGQNVANTLRQRMTDVLLKKGESRGFSPDELAQMETIARGTKGENAIRFAGNVLGGGGGISAAITGLMSAGIAPAVGYGLKQLSNSMTMRQVTKLSEMIRSNAPLASSMEKFGEKAQAFAADKSPRARADAVLAARNLANNLKASGIVLTGKSMLDDYSNQSL